MKKQHKFSPLAIMIASTLSVSGCGGDSSSVDNATPNKEVTPQTEIDKQEMAQVNLAVKFPQADASAAWIGDSKSIEVNFFNTKDVGSIGEAYDALDANRCDEDEHNEYNEYKESNCYNPDPDVLKGQFATSVFMDTATPSATISLLPGKYRVEAKFYNALSKHQETSLSYITLSKGAHSLKLRGIEATWTATEQLTLQLLNKVGDFDWDPDTAGIQSPAEMMGITGAIKGLHLPSVLTYPDGYLSGQYEQGQGHWDDILINAGVTSVDGLDREAQATAFQPVLRIDNGSGGEFNVLPHYINENKQNLSEEGEWLSSNGFWNSTELATLKQEYTSDGEKALLDLGGYYLGYWKYESGENTNDRVELDFGLVSIDELEGEAPYSIYSARTVDNETLTIASINTSENNNSRAYWQQLFIDLKGAVNTIVDGSTITGYLIESEIHEVSVTAVNWQGTGADVAPSFIEAAMLGIAEAEGLIAKSAADETCQTQTLNGLDYSNEYLWDEATQGWIPGTYNSFMEVYDGSLLTQIDNKITETEEAAQTTQTTLDDYQQQLATMDAEIALQVETVDAEITAKTIAIEAEYDTAITEKELQITAQELQISEQELQISEKEAEISDKEIAIAADISAQELERNAAVTNLDAAAIAIDELVTTQATIISNYETASLEAEAAQLIASEKGQVLNDISDQITLYDNGLLPACDTACYTALQLEEQTAQTENSDAFTAFMAKRNAVDVQAILYNPVATDIYALYEPISSQYYWWGDGVLDISAINTDLAEVKTALIAQEFFASYDLVNELENLQYNLTNLQSDLSYWQNDVTLQNDLATLQAQRADIANRWDITQLQNQKDNLQNNNWERNNLQTNVDNTTAAKTQKAAELAQLVQLKLDATLLVDLNGDGEATLFEPNVFVATGSLYAYLNNSSGYDYDLNMYVNDYELNIGDYTLAPTVKASTLTGTQTICVQPFTLKASQLSLVLDTKADVIIE